MINYYPLYIANSAGVEAADRKGRYNIKLTYVQYIGTDGIPLQIY